MTDDEGNAAGDPEADIDGGDESERADDPEDIDRLVGGNPEDGEEAVDDPFAELGTGVDDETVDSDASDPDLHDPDEPRSGSASPSSGPQASDAADPDPFAELGGGTAGAETDAELEDAFERMNVGDVADEDVWESLDEDLADGSAGPAAGSEAGELSQGAGPTAASGTDEGVEHVVDKRSYCQQCPHFTPPPDVSCDHEGTTIAEVVGFDEFRVRNCPMVSDEDPTFTDRR